MNEEKLTVREMAFRYERYKKITGESIILERYINTDKYKEYIPRWKITGNPNGHGFVIKDSLNVVVAEVNVFEDAILMRDSPKLLAEVRRLRGLLLKIVQSKYIEDEEKYIGDEEIYIGDEE
mgnify:CR=1 FL=1